jgi:hypothetical protein
MHPQPYQRIAKIIERYTKNDIKSVISLIFSINRDDIDENDTDKYVEIMCKTVHELNTSHDLFKVCPVCEYYYPFDHDDDDDDAESKDTLCERCKEGVIFHAIPMREN